MSLSLSLRFDGHTVRMVGTQERPEWIARDVCRVLHLHNTSMAVLNAGVLSAEKGISRIDTPGGPQEVGTVTEPGLWKLVMASRKPAAMRFKSWLAEDVIPCIRRHGCFPAPSAPSTLGLARQMLEALEAQERQLAEHGTRIARIEARHEVAQVELLALPPAAVDAPEKPPRAALNQRVRAWGASHGGTYQEAWRKLKGELLYRLRFDADARSRHSGRHWLDEVEVAGQMPALYAIACEVLPGTDH